ncbi:MAG: hypothetical protein J6581_10090, partial [Apibacter sp.]|nr:hypothetical protein [Apibacter sp.]
FNIEKENLYIKLNYKKRKNFLEVSVEGKELILLFYSEVDFKNDFRKNLENNTKNLIVFAKNICDDFACYFGK